MPLLVNNDNSSGRMLKTKLGEGVNPGSGGGYGEVGWEEIGEEGGKLFKYNVFVSMTVPDPDNDPVAVRDKVLELVRTMQEASGTGHLKLFNNFDGKITIQDMPKGVNGCREFLDWKNNRRRAFNVSFGLKVESSVSFQTMKPKIFQFLRKQEIFMKCNKTLTDKAYKCVQIGMLANIPVGIHRDEFIDERITALLETYETQEEAWKQENKLAPEYIKGVHLTTGTASMEMTTGTYWIDCAVIVNCPQEVVEFVKTNFQKSIKEQAWSPMLKKVAFVPFDLKRNTAAPEEKQQKATFLQLLKLQERFQTTYGVVTVIGVHSENMAILKRRWVEECKDIIHIEGTLQWKRNGQWKIYCLADKVGEVETFLEVHGKAPTKHPQLSIPFRVQYRGKMHGKVSPAMEYLSEYTDPEDIKKLVDEVEFPQLHGGNNRNSKVTISRKSNAWNNPPSISTVQSTSSGQPSTMTIPATTEATSQIRTFEEEIELFKQELKAESAARKKESEENRTTFLGVITDMRTEFQNQINEVRNETKEMYNQLLTLLKEMKDDRARQEPARANSESASLPDPGQYLAMTPHRDSVGKRPPQESPDGKRNPQKKREDPRENANPFQTHFSEVNNDMEMADLERDGPQKDGGKPDDGGPSQQ